MDTETGYCVQSTRTHSIMKQLELLLRIPNRKVYNPSHRIYFSFSQYLPDNLHVSKSFFFCFIFPDISSIFPTHFPVSLSDFQLWMTVTSLLPLSRNVTGHCITTRRRKYCIFRITLQGRRNSLKSGGGSKTVLLVSFVSLAVYL